MTKNLLRTLVAILAVAFVFEMPPAYAVFGIRAARTVMAARKAKQVTSSSDSDADKAYAEEEARFGRHAENKAAPLASQQKLAAQEKEDVTFDDVP